MKESPYKRAIRSFVRREGRMTPSQQRALDELWPKYGIDFTSAPLNFSEIFGNASNVILEIGFGMGQSLVMMAKALPHKNFLGIEVHRPGVGALLAHLEADQCNNVRVIQHDAVEVLKLAIRDHSLEKIQIFFPDPWPKKRHHKRRLIQSEFLQLLWQKLQPNGILHLATDWENYAEHMQAALNSQPNFTIADAATRHQHLQLRPTTKFQRRGEKLGHGVWDIVFIKTKIQPKA